MASIGHQGVSEYFPQSSIPAKGGKKTLTVLAVPNEFLTSVI